MAGHSYEQQVILFFMTTALDYISQSPLQEGESNI